MDRKSALCLGVLFFVKGKQSLKGIIDIHCHILPGVDDGARNEKEAENMLRLQKRMGVECMILTPHYFPGVFVPSVSQIRMSYQRLKPVANKMGMKLLLGREYHVVPGYEKDLQCRQLPAMADTSYVLVEFSEKNSYYTIRNVAEQMLQQQYRPVIAHIERYFCLRSLQHVEELRRMGVCLQVNAGTVMGKSGKEAKEYCWKLMKQDAIQLIASDAHRMDGRKPNLGKCYQLVKKKMGESYAEKIFRSNPLMLIENKEIE